MTLQGRVLVVDDDPLNLDLLGRRLEAHGFTYTLVETGQEGLSRAREEAYECLLLDLRLPDIDGEEILAILRQERPRLPIVIMTAHGSPAVRSQVLAAGAAAYLLKPVRRQELMDLLAEVIRHAREENEARP